jgi:hypothetical protein
LISPHSRRSRPPSPVPSDLRSFGGVEHAR